MNTALSSPGDWLNGHKQFRLDAHAVQVDRLMLVQAAGAAGGTGARDGLAFAHVVADFGGVFA